MFLQGIVCDKSGNFFEDFFGGMLKVKLNFHVKKPAFRDVTEV